MFVDASYVVALLSPRDQNHARAKELAVEFQGQAVVTTDAVLLEVGNWMAKGFRSKAVALIRDFLSSSDVQVVPLSPQLFRQGLDLYDMRHDKDWGLVDCISFVVMKREGLSDALAFDQHFVQAGFRLL